MFFLWCVLLPELRALTRTLATPCTQLALSLTSQEERKEYKGTRPLDEMVMTGREWTYLDLAPLDRIEALHDHDEVLHTTDDMWVSLPLATMRRLVQSQPVGGLCEWCIGFAICAERYDLAEVLYAIGGWSPVIHNIVLGVFNANPTRGGRMLRELGRRGMTLCSIEQCHFPAVRLDQWHYPVCDARRHDKGMLLKDGVLRLPGNTYGQDVGARVTLREGVDPYNRRHWALRK
jgi:hypothetical protein